jgi:hypothetical protein
MIAGFTVEYTPVRGSRQRVRYEPRADDTGHWRIEEAWTGCRWRTRGREPVQDVVCDHDEAAGE